MAHPDLATRVRAMHATKTRPSGADERLSRLGVRRGAKMPLLYFAHDSENQWRQGTRAGSHRARN